MMKIIRTKYIHEYNFIAGLKDNKPALGPTWTFILTGTIYTDKEKY